MQVDPNIGLQQIILSLLVRNPVVEENVSLIKSQFFAEGNRLVYCLHLGQVRVRPLDAHEKKFHIVALLKDERQASDQGRRIEPVPDASPPQDHLIAGSDGFIDPFQNGVCTLWRFFRQTKRHHVYEAPQGRVLLVSVRIHASQCRKHSQPVIALFFTGADKEIAGPELKAERLQVVLVRGQFSEQIGLGLTL